ILFGKSDQNQTQFFVIAFINWLVLLAGTGNVDNSTCAPFGSSKLLTGVDYGLMQLINRQAFGFK
ncbi:MAG: hypothetical protein ABJN78_05720, partial [Hyphomicrobiales bacterium]